MKIKKFMIIADIIMNKVFFIIAAVQIVSNKL